MINGGHVILYSKDADADRQFIKNVLKFKYVDVHNGWLTFRLPPSEIAVHPSDENDMHEFYLMTDDLDLEIASLKKAGAALRNTFVRALFLACRCGVRQALAELAAFTRQHIDEAA